MSGDPRIAAAERALAAFGIAARVEVEGTEGEIAAVVPDEGTEVAALLGDRAVADAVRAAGFRYVAVDLAGMG